MIMIYSRHVAAIQDKLQANQYTVFSMEARKAWIFTLSHTLILILNIPKPELNQYLLGMKKYCSAYFN